MLTTLLYLTAGAFVTLRAIRKNPAIATGRQRGYNRVYDRYGQIVSDERIESRPPLWWAVWLLWPVVVITYYMVRAANATHRGVLSYTEAVVQEQKAEAEKARAADGVTAAAVEEVNRFLLKSVN